MTAAHVAVKVQYPGADQALLSDLRQLGRFSRLIQPLVPGIEIRPLINELRDRMAEELDYRDEADNQRAFAKAFDGDPEIMIPKVIASAPKAMITEWVTGTPVSRIIAGGDQDTRDEVGRLLTTMLYSSAPRVGMMHADAHPGNFQLMPDGRLLVIDFGLVARLPDGWPVTLQELTGLALRGKSEQLMTRLRAEGFVRPGTALDADEVFNFLAPFVDPLRTERFAFTRQWLQGQAQRITDTQGSNFRTARALNLPAQHMLIHRVAMGTVGVLCQLGATIPFRSIVTRWQPFIDQE